MTRYLAAACLGWALASPAAAQPAAAGQGTAAAAQGTAAAAQGTSEQTVPSPATTAGENTPAQREALAERDRKAEALAQSMMSPFCPGRTLSACPSPKAAEWRADIRIWLGEGVSAEEIRQRLGARIPQHDLFGIPKTPLGWLLPIALVLAALAVLVGLLRVLIKPRALAEGSEDAPAAAGDEAAAQWEARLDQELEAIDPQ